MDYYLRVEAVNLGNFVYDTSNLSTIRGGGVLLLDAMDFVEKEINNLLLSLAPDSEEVKREQDMLTKEINAIKHDNTLSKNEKEVKKKIVREKKKQAEQAARAGECEAITKGASWGLFKIDASPHAVCGLTEKVEKAFNASKCYKHATFVINLYEADRDEEYTSCRSKAQTLNRWQQLQKPSIAICREGKDICTYDKVRPAEKKSSRNEYLSESVYCRRKYGKKIKQDAKEFYVKRTENATLTSLELTNDFNELSSCEPDSKLGNLGGKIAFIYIDGNKFGKRQQDCKEIPQQRDFDQKTRKGREKLLNEILIQITANKANHDWFHDEKLRLETLLWGGDEIIWVVPAWQGWWMMNEFYKLAQEHICLPDEKLYHGASLVFCNHKAPIQTIDTLARSLADGFAKIPPFKKRNMIAYQVLESFDHAGADLMGHRRMLIDGLSENVSDLLIDAEKMDEIEKCIRALKNIDFPKRKIYQIVHSFKRGKTADAEAFYKKIVNPNDNDIEEKKQQKTTIKTLLGELKPLFNVCNKETPSDIFWLHLLQLWDYVGFEPTATQQGGE